MISERGEKLHARHYPGISNGIHVNSVAQRLGQNFKRFVNFRPFSSELEPVFIYSRFISGDLETTFSGKLTSRASF